jgi:hypothetical protein
MQEFALSAERQLGELPANAAQRDLLLQATQLRSLVAEKSAVTYQLKRAAWQAPCWLLIQCQYPRERRRI